MPTIPKSMQSSQFIAVLYLHTDVGCYISLQLIGCYIRVFHFNVTALLQ